MDEDRSPEHYEDHRGDISLWRADPVEAEVRKGGSVVFSFRLSAEELELLRDTAKIRGVTISELVRQAALRDSTGGEPAFRVYVSESGTARATGDFRVSGIEVPSSGPGVLERAGYKDSSVVA